MGYREYGYVCAGEEGHPGNCSNVIEVTLGNRPWRP